MSGWKGYTAKVTVKVNPTDAEEDEEHTVETKIDESVDLSPFPVQHSDPQN